MTRAQAVGRNSSPGRKRQRDRTRSALIDATQQLLAEQGVVTTIQEIAERAGVGVGSLYNHFGDKERLFEAASREALADFEAWLIARTEGIPDSAERLSARIRLFCGSPETHPAYSRIWTLPDTMLMAAPTTYSEKAVDDVRLVVSDRRLDCPDPRSALIMIVGACNSLLILGNAAGRVDREQVDAIAEEALVLIGMPRDAAREIARRPLPSL